MFLLNCSQLLASVLCLALIDQAFLVSELLNIPYDQEFIIKFLWEIS